VRPASILAIVSEKLLNSIHQFFISRDEHIAPDAAISIYGIRDYNPSVVPPMELANPKDAAPSRRHAAVSPIDDHLEAVEIDRMTGDEVIAESVLSFRAVVAKEPLAQKEFFGLRDGRKMNRRVPDIFTSANDQNSQ
jgi:hypothetical protein